MKKVFLRVDSKGTQEKYRDGNYWYKKNHLGDEGMAEMLCSMVLRYSKMPSDVTYVNYEIADFIIDEKIKHGCRSVNFLNDGEEYISVQTLYFNLNKTEIEDKIFSIEDIGERFAFACDFVKNATGLDNEFSDYLKTLISLDYFTRNPDRHWGNIGVIMRSDGSFRSCPIFDNGQAFGQNYNITPPDISYEKALEKLTSATLCDSFENALKSIGGSVLQIDFVGLTKDLSEIPDCSAKRFLDNRIIDCKKVFMQSIMDVQKSSIVNHKGGR